MCFLCLSANEQKWGILCLSASECLFMIVGPIVAHLMLIRPAIAHLMLVRVWKIIEINLSRNDVFFLCRSVQIEKVFPLKSICFLLILNIRVLNRVNP